jgi:hypothetical protein
MKTAAAYDVFVSHNRRQKPWVRHIANFLREKGLKVFFDEDSINPGEDFILALERAIESSETLVLVLSRSSVFSKWVAMETAQAIYEQMSSPHHRLIPILIEPVDKTLIRPGIRRLDPVDLTDPRTRESEFLHFLRSLGLSDVPATQLPPWPEPSRLEELRVTDFTDVMEWNWSGPQLLEKLISLDYKMFDELTPEQEGSVSQWAPVFVDHPDTWRLLTTPNHEIVGYWHFVPLFDEDFQRALCGELRYAEITTDRVRVFEFPGSYPIFLVSFSLLPGFRTRGYKLLFGSLLDVLLELAKERVFVDQICANAFSAAGDSLCKTFKMTCLGTHIERGKIYVTNTNDALQHEFCQDYKELRTIYLTRSDSSGNDQEIRAAVP